MPASPHHRDGKEVQSLAFSGDGIQFTKFEGNPILDIEAQDFRDPKLFRFGSEWRMVVAVSERAYIYSSPDLYTWTLCSEFAAPFPGWKWECPDLFRMGDTWVMIGSFIVPNSPHLTYYWVGEFDGVHFKPHRSCAPPFVWAG